MGLLRLFSEKIIFVADLSKTEYENWLIFLEQGGNTKQWEKLKRDNKWIFIKDPIEAISEYEEKFSPLFNEYSESALNIKTEWKTISNEKIYSGHRANLFVELCKHNIELYKKMVILENQHSRDHLQESEGYKRLAMIYEKQENYEKAIEVCKEAILLGDIKSMPSRLDRMIKKLRREATDEEKELIQKGI